MAKKSKPKGKTNPEVVWNWESVKESKDYQNLILGNTRLMVCETVRFFPSKPLEREYFYSARFETFDFSNERIGYFESSTDDIAKWLEDLLEDVATNKRTKNHILPLLQKAFVGVYREKLNSLFPWRRHVGVCLHDRTFESVTYSNVAILRTRGARTKTAQEQNRSRISRRLVEAFANSASFFALTAWNLPDDRL